MGIRGQAPSEPVDDGRPIDFSPSSSSHDEKEDADDVSAVEEDEEQEPPIISISTLDASSPVKVEPDNVKEEPAPYVGTVDAEDMEHEHRLKKEEEEYRLHVYGFEDVLEKQSDSGSPMPSRSSFRRFSRQMSESLYRRSSSIAEKLPETPAGWAVLLSVLGSAFLGYEIQLQQSLTAPPLVFGQVYEGPLHDIYRHLTETPKSILRRVIQPSLFVGTRGLVSSMASYFMGGPAKTEKHLRFREIMSMTQDGAQVGVDWELPAASANDGNDEQRKQQTLKGPIRTPVVLILHGINNDASFGYVRSLMRACCDRGWVAAGMNFRGCGGVPLTTPRSYNGAYTGDIRCVVHHIAARLDGDDAYLFLIGNSLGGNLVIKYLGEEGLSGTLSPKVAGGVSLGNPMSINSGNMNYMISPIMTLGVKKTALENWHAIRQFKEKNFQSHLYKAMCAVTLAEWDEALAPCYARNRTEYPFSYQIGYKNGHAYWTDASSYRLIRHISVPTLQIMAADDLLCYNPFLKTFSYSLANPNVMLVETRCGGHLGWQESPPQDTNTIFSAVTSWSDVATTDFIEAVLRTKENNTNITTSTDVNMQIHNNTTGSAAPRIQSRL